MPRTRLHEQPCYEFTYQISVQARDTSSVGHLAHHAILQITHEARLSMLHAMGLHELDLGDGKTSVITGDVAVNFKGEAFMFDALCVQSHVGEISPDGFRVFHRITRAEEPIALAEAGLIGIDYGTCAIVPIPETFNRAFVQYRQGLQNACRK